MEKNTQKPNESVGGFREHYMKVLDGDFADMLEMKFADFRKEAVECLKNLYEMVYATTEILKAHNEKLDPIATTVFFLALKAKGGPITKKDRREICEMLGYEWTGEEEGAFRSCVGG